MNTVQATSIHEIKKQTPAQNKKILGALKFAKANGFSVKKRKGKDTLCL